MSTPSATLGETPRTDAAVQIIDDDDGAVTGLEYVSPEFARQLERELAEALDELDMQEDTTAALGDELAQRSETVPQTCTDAKERDEGCFRAVRAERERDEAQAELRAARELYAKESSARSARAAPNGWKLVPLVPTDEMEKAAAHEDNAFSNNRFTFPSESRFFNVYCAMLRTAPEPK